MSTISLLSALQRRVPKNLRTLSKYGKETSKYGHQASKYGYDMSKYGRSVHSCCILRNKEYEESFRRSVESREEFWAEKAEDITWFKKYDRILDFSDPPHSKWYVSFLV